MHVFVCVRFRELLLPRDEEPLILAVCATAEKAKQACEADFGRPLSWLSTSEGFEFYHHQECYLIREQEVQE